MIGIEEMNRRTGQTVGELNHIAGEVESSVNQAIVSLQFQDMVTQLLGHVVRASRCWAKSPGTRAPVGGAARHRRSRSGVAAHAVAFRNTSSSFPKSSRT